jgi:hypothetical protein
MTVYEESQPTTQEITGDGRSRRVVWQWLSHHPEVKEVHEYKKAIRRFYRLRGYERVQKALGRICDLMGCSKQKEVRELRKVLLDWREEIFLQPANAGSQGTHGIAKRARFYRGFPILRTNKKPGVLTNRRVFSGGGKERMFLRLFSNCLSRR